MPGSKGNSSGAIQELNAKLSVDELIKRLKASNKYLSECECLDDDNSSVLHKAAEDLVQPFLHHHRSREVRTLAACCIADVFRIFYPDPPYDDDQMKIVFSLFVSQLQGLEKPSQPPFKHSFQLLESLANLRVFVLCLTMEAQDILADLFKMIFSIINNEQSSKVKNYMQEILSSLMQEGESLSQEIIDIILLNIVEPAKSDNKPLYNFTVEFIRKTSSYIEPYIHLFFNKMLVTGKTAESEVAEHIYDLILELHGIDSSVLLSVLPQLEFKLRSTDIAERHEVTKLLARMFSPKGSQLAVENRPLWNCFLQRFNDVSPGIRVECVRYSKYFLVYHSHLKEDATLRLHERFYDREERVRLEVVKAVCEAAADNFDAVPKQLWEDLQGRMRDKVWNIRKESIGNVARLYRQLMSSSFSSGSSSMKSSDAKSLSWIPTKILHCYYRQSPEDMLCVERCLLSCLVPVNLKPQERMERMINVYATLEDENANKAFDAILLTRHGLRNRLLNLLSIHKRSDLDTEKKKQAMLTTIIQLARGLPDPLKVQSNLQELIAMLDDSKFSSSLSNAINTSLSCQEVLKAKAEVVSKVSSKSGLLETMRSLLDRTCPMLIDAQCIQILTEKVCGSLCDPSLSLSQEEEEEEKAKAKKAIQLLKVLATISPTNFGSKEVCEPIVSLIRNEDLEIAGPVLRILTLAGEHIDKSIAGVLQPVLTRLAQSGHPKLAKNSVKCIQQILVDPKPILERLLSSLLTHLDYDDSNLHTVLISLGQIAKLQPEVFATKHKGIIRDFIVKNLLVVDRAVDEYVEDAEEWCSDEEVSYEAQTKVLGIKLLVKWLLGLTSDYEKSSNPVLRLLTTVLAHDGDLQGDDNVSAPDRSRLRLVSACGLLKLAQCPNYKELISPDQFLRVALTMQDTCYEVRKKFCIKLNKGLKNLQLPLGYLAVFVYSGIEPNKETKYEYRKMIVASVEKRREYLKQHSVAKENPHAVLPEYAVSHAVYLVAHHPDFTRTNPQKLDVFKECLWFFLEPIAVKGDNYGFLRKLLENIKMTVDAQDPTNSESNKNIYAACDLAMGVLLSKISHPKLGSFDGSVILPAKLFKSKGKNAQPNDIRYLPPEYDCTPTKRVKTEASASPNTSVAETPKRAAKGKQVREVSKTPTKAKKGGSSQSNTPAKGKEKKPQSPKKAGAASATKAARAAKPKPAAKQKAKVPKAKEESIEEAANGEEDEVESTPSKGRKRARVTQQANKKRNVRRKVLQEEDDNDGVDTEGDTAMEVGDEADSQVEEATLPSSKSYQKSVKQSTRTRSSKRKVTVKDEETASEEAQANGDVTEDQLQSDGEVPSPSKKQKVQSEEISAEPASSSELKVKDQESSDSEAPASTGIKRRTRHRR